jgi:CheY-like chemotaxis protein
MLVALTGWGQDEDKRRAYAAGFDVHMVKPVALRDLQALLARVNADARPSTATTD